VQFEGGQPRAGAEQAVTVQAGQIPGVQFRLVDSADQLLQPLPLQPDPDGLGGYSGRAVLPPKEFRVVAEGVDAQGYPIQRLDGRLFEPK
jgi:hypothetical protein